MKSYWTCFFQHISRAIYIAHALFQHIGRALSHCACYFPTYWTGNIMLNWQHHIEHALFQRIERAVSYSACSFPTYWAGNSILNTLYSNILHVQYHIAHSLPPANSWRHPSLTWRPHGRASRRYHLCPGSCAWYRQIWHWQEAKRTQHQYCQRVRHGAGCDLAPVGDSRLPCCGACVECNVCSAGVSPSSMPPTVECLLQVAHL